MHVNDSQRTTTRGRLAEHQQCPKRIWWTSIRRGEPWRGGREAVTWRREEGIE
ncbi:uncharacterized protein LACBIDRAFT_303362 [Laccaria bicolor S238N-H82]|uniref:Predicted protein n=1 Tax=Laccaria bicolor (strain S238N-H82 / ATCC MYA-4686) TaxID=486041 RepID=B0DJD8_LACBS|nr:uncharacterized protein LACBIDRAFT_303362 [Laccaria bicolor S238N-H82]EDR05504.1 predicted protein [Laccaria bicolor S238N-H82]|eukprot:XP_001884062.1 predicted protein [Laccaria bicolor S238N-H82]